MVVSFSLSLNYRWKVSPFGFPDFACLVSVLLGGTVVSV